MGSAYTTYGMRNLSISHSFTVDATLLRYYFARFDVILLLFLSSSPPFHHSYPLLSVPVAVGYDFQTHQFIE
jgi:hypothetical protein